ncbi:MULTISPECIES: hypothetical protein [Hyphomonas]|nr:MULTISPECIES: hypothetical protein [Hyphomonas]
MSDEGDRKDEPDARAASLPGRRPKGQRDMERGSTGQGDKQ